MASKQEYVTTKSGKRCAVRVQSVGVHFGCVGKLTYRGKVIAETRTYPLDNRAAAFDAALALAEVV